MVKLDEEIAAAARALETGTGADAGYLARVRAGARRFDPIEVAPGDVRGALRLLEDHVEIAADAPVASARPAVAFVKRAIRALIGWYARWLAHQTTLFSRAVVRFATATVERLETIERAVGDPTASATAIGDLRADVEALTARVAALEEAPRRRSLRSG